MAARRGNRASFGWSRRCRPSRRPAPAAHQGRKAAGCVKTSKQKRRKARSARGRRSAARAPAGVCSRRVSYWTGRAGRHAGHAPRQRSKCLASGPCRRPSPGLADENDATAGGVHLLAPQQIGRAGRQAEAAMDAGLDEPPDPVRPLDARPRTGGGATPAGSNRSLTLRINPTGPRSLRPTDRASPARRSGHPARHTARCEWFLAGTRSAAVSGLPSAAGSWIQGGEAARAHQCFRRGFAWPVMAAGRAAGRRTPSPPTSPR